MSTAIQITTATPSDTPALVRLMTRSWCDAYLPLLPHAVEEGAVSVEVAGRWTPWPEDELILVARQGSDMLGLARVKPGEPAELSSLHVSGAARGLGIGGRLLAKVLEAAPHLRLWVARENTAAIRFYARHGAERDGADDLVICGQSVPAICMIWQ